MCSIDFNLPFTVATKNTPIEKCLDPELFWLYNTPAGRCPQMQEVKEVLRVSFLIFSKHARMHRERESKLLPLIFYLREMYCNAYLFFKIMSVPFSFLFFSFSYYYFGWLVTFTISFLCSYQPFGKQRTGKTHQTHRSMVLNT